MRIEIVKYKPHHYELIGGWWDAREFPAPPKELLPRRGAVIEIDDEPICAGFITFTDANCAVICHLVSNPKASGLKRNDALDYLLSYLIDTARRFSYKAVFASASNDLPKLMERFAKHELFLTDKNINAFGRFL